MSRTICSAVVFAAGFLLAGCGPNMTVRQRGWLGGSYTKATNSIFARDYQTEAGGAVPALPKDVSSYQCAALVVTGLDPETPLAKAGIMPGDLIVAVDGKKVTSPGKLYKSIDAAAPGSKVTVKTWRKGTFSEVPVVVGTESYRQLGYLKIGFGLGTTLKLFPDPDFNLFNLVRVAVPDRRNSPHSPEYQYLSSASPKAPEVRNNLWDIWLVIMGVGKYDQIVAQTVADDQTIPAGK
jgi:membrane-associated protease RseP (regulator of RpoE activity)